MESPPSDARPAESTFRAAVPVRVEPARRRRGLGALGRGQPWVRVGRWWLTVLGALRYSLAVRAPGRAVRVLREPFGGRTAPSTYDFTR
jgi:hypothetical protein